MSKNLEYLDRVNSYMWIVCRRHEYCVWLRVQCLRLRLLCMVRGCRVFWGCAIPQVFRLGLTAEARV